MLHLWPECLFFFIAECCLASRALKRTILPLCRTSWIFRLDRPQQRRWFTGLLGQLPQDVEWPPLGICCRGPSADGQVQICRD